MKKLEKGFTLIELMIVVAIIAILAAVAAPKFGQQLAKAKDGKALQVIGTWRSAFTMHYADNSVYADKLGDIKSYVDAGTIKATTFEDDNKYGTVVAGSPTQVAFTITGTAVDSSIIITTNASDSALKTNWKDK